MSEEKWAAGQRLVSKFGVSGTFGNGVPQATWEELGWRPAESPAAPVERALSPGWVKHGKEDWECTHMSGGRYDCVADALWCHGEFKGACVAHAEEMGVFATPAPTVTVTARENLLNGTWSVPTESTPKPVPRCEYRTAAHEGTPVGRVMGKVARRLYVCDACYLYSEGKFAVLPSEPADNRPRATVGVVPQAFGLSVGILSRGMAK